MRNNIIPTSFDRFCKDHYNAFSHRGRVISGSKDDRLIVEHAEMRILTLLFLEQEGHKCEDSIKKATQELTQSYGLILTGNTSNQNADLAAGFVEKAQKEIKHFLAKKQRGGHEGNVDAALEVCDAMLASRLKKGNVPPSARSRAYLIVGSALKHFLAMSILRQDGYMCDTTFMQAQKNLYLSCIEAKLVSSAAAAPHYASDLIEALHTRLAMGRNRGHPS